MVKAATPKRTKPKKPAGDVLAWRGRNPLRVWMDGSGTSAVELAKKLGVHRATVYSYIYGYGTPPLEKWAMFTKITGISQTKWIAWKNQCPPGGERR